MKKILCLGAFLSAAALATANPVLAQKSTTRGLHLGVQLQGSAIKFQSGRRDQGGGGGVKIG